MTETDDLTALRSTVVQLNDSEKLALATYLTKDCNPDFWSNIYTEADHGSAIDAVDDAFQVCTGFPVNQKLAFAIELLQFCQDEEEATAAPRRFLPSLPKN